MTNRMAQRIFLGGVLLGRLLGSAAAGQAAARKPLPPELAPSPEIHPDRRVTFRLFAPRAAEVAVRGEFNRFGKQSLRKDRSGLWALTVGPLEAGIYTYLFLVDGRQALDPNNDWVTPGPGSGPKASLVLVPGEKPMPWEPGDVPHGTLHVHWYKPRARGEPYRLHVYTPPGYADAREKYPVLYLLHGSGANDMSWTYVGRAHFIVDRLIADRKAVPMVIVMPENNAALAPTGSAVEDELLKDVLPFVERSYRVRTDGEGHAIAGFSIGGSHALLMGLRHPDRFAWVGAFSAGMMQPDWVAPLVGKGRGRVNRGLRLLWVGCGKGDAVYQENKALTAALGESGIKHVWRPTGGGHTWSVARGDLIAFAPRLFRPANRPPK